MNAQTITTPAGDRLVVLPEVEFNALVAAAEDSADHAAVARFRDKLADGNEELLPAAMVDRILNGESRVTVWRTHRGLTVGALAREAGIDDSCLSQIETGQRDGTVETFRRIAAALHVTLDDLAG